MEKHEVRQIIKKELRKAFNPELDYISIKAVCESLGLSRTSIYRMISRGQLTRYKIGSRSYLKVTEVNKLGKEMSAEHD